MRLESKLCVKLLATAGILFGLCALGPAPLMGQKLGIKPHTNLHDNSEKTLQSEQTPVQMGQVGSGPEAHHDLDVAIQPGRSEGEAVLAAGAQRSLANDPNADQVLKAASARVAPQSNRSWMWIGLVFLCLGGAIFGAKRWADTNIPNVPTATPKRQGW
ncbi:MAG TPA: hypothetical protein VKT78_12855 [Fimbriimonadaceae bacterium]|nr:hypothetical protein [Fimbriimonadaceae bacterium]